LRQAFLYTSVSACVSPCTRVQVRVCARVCDGVCVCVCVRVCMFSNEGMNVRGVPCLCTVQCTCDYARVGVHVHVFVRECMCAFMILSL